MGCDGHAGGKSYENMSYPGEKWETEPSLMSSRMEDRGKNPVKSKLINLR